MSSKYLGCIGVIKPENRGGPFYRLRGRGNTFIRLKRAQGSAITECIGGVDKDNKCQAELSLVYFI